MTMKQKAENKTADRRAMRGFASMSPEKRRRIASKGGKAAQRKGTGHRWASSEEAAAAGSKGGKAAQAAGTGNRFTSESARAARRKTKSQRGGGSHNG
jgi:hypothetical protein